MKNSVLWAILCGITQVISAVVLLVVTIYFMCAVRCKKEFMFMIQLLILIFLLTLTSIIIVLSSVAVIQDVI
jgi:hypothetical protein